MIRCRNPDAIGKLHGRTGGLSGLGHRRMRGAFLLGLGRARLRSFYPAF
jgi:hypothetical protein